MTFCSVFFILKLLIYTTKYLYGTHIYSDPVSCSKGCIEYAISAYHYWCCEFESRSGRGVQHYVMKFVSGLLQVGDFHRVLRFPPPIKLTATI
jgi:hypothetical protein